MILARRSSLARKQTAEGHQAKPMRSEQHTRLHRRGFHHGMQVGQRAKAVPLRPFSLLPCVLGLGRRGGLR